MNSATANQFADPAAVAVLIPENLSAIPTAKLFVLIDQLFGELDSATPSTATLNQYNDITFELERRQSLNLPEITLGGEGR